MLRFYKGERVYFKTQMDDSDKDNLLQRWIASYGRGPFVVFGVLNLDCTHISIGYENGKDIHLGSSAWLWVDSNFFTTAL